MLFNFTTATTQGEQIQSGILVQDSSCNLYGTTYRGGAHSNRGTVYEISPETGGSCPSGSNTGNGACEALLHSFSSSERALSPCASVPGSFRQSLGPNGQRSGANSNGIVFELTPGSGGSWTYTTYPFPAYTGTTPGGSGTAFIANPSGGFYGASPNSGGVNSTGEIWNFANGSFTDVWDVPAGDTNLLGAATGAFPLDSSGNFYGVWTVAISTARSGKQFHPRML